MFKKGILIPIRFIIISIVVIIIICLSGQGRVILDVTGGFIIFCLFFGFMYLIYKTSKDIFK
jgi:hypothetical protein